MDGIVLTTKFNFDTMIMMSGAATSKTESNWADKAGIAAHFRCSIRHIGNQMRSRKIPYVSFGQLVVSRPGQPRTIRGSLCFAQGQMRQSSAHLLMSRQARQQATQLPKKSQA
jgi:hypothetical protein